MNSPCWSIDKQFGGVSIISDRNQTDRNFELDAALRGGGFGAALRDWETRLLGTASKKCLGRLTWMIRIARDVRYLVESAC